MSASSTSNFSNEAGVPESQSRPMREQQGCLARGQSQLRELARDREARTILLALAAGLGVGYLLGSALSGSSRRNGWGHRAEAESLGRRVLERLDQYLPDAVSRHFDNR